MVTTYYSSLQEIALQDVRKEMSFCRKVGLRMLGLVENMSVFICPKCSKSSSVFPSSSAAGVDGLCAGQGVPLLGRIPLDPRIGRACDEGRSIFEDEDGQAATASSVAQAYRDIIVRLKEELAKDNKC